MKNLSRSFAGGEIAPEMQGRLDLTKFQTGLALSQNFITLAHGPVARRPGLQYINESKDSTQQSRLFPFVYSATQALILEFGPGWIRFHNQTGTVVETAGGVTAVTQANPGKFTQAAHSYANGDWVYLATLGGMTSLNGRWYKVTVVDANNYNLTTLAGVAVDTTALPAYAGGGTASRAYTVATPWTSAEVQALHYTQSADVLTLFVNTRQTYELRRLGATNWTLTASTFAPTIASPTGVSAAATVAAGTGLGPITYAVTAVAPDLTSESLATVAASVNNNLATGGNYNTISWSAVSGAGRYYVYKSRGGVLGFIGQTSGLSLIDDNVLAEVKIVPPEQVYTLNDASGKYPSTGTYHEQRKWFAGMTNIPQSIYATRNATESNLTSGVVSQDDDALFFRIAASQQNAIRHLVSLADLLVLTSGGEFRVYSQNGAITPTDIIPKAQAYSGASDVQPVVTANSCLYVQSQGSHVREVSYDPSGTGRYQSIDISLMAPHLVDGYTITQLAYSRAPDQILWALRSDGVLLGLSYVPEQQVLGWHRHITDGVIESIAVIPEGSEDALYVLVRRTVNSRTVRYVERLKSRLFTSQADWFFVDSGLSYSGAATSTLSGLWHLEGRTVKVLTDGGVHPDVVVTNGAITLSYTASAIQVGLAIQARIKLLPQRPDSVEAAGVGAAKNVEQVHLGIVDSMPSFMVGPDFVRMTAGESRAVSDLYGNAPSAQSTTLSIPVSPDWNPDGAICFDIPTPTQWKMSNVAAEFEIGS